MLWKAWHNKLVKGYVIKTKKNVRGLRKVCVIILSVNRAKVPSLQIVQRKYSRVPMILDDIPMNSQRQEISVVDGEMSAREEGEISDLDLETVSDCSLSLGNSPEKRQRSHDVSLFSSISDSDSNSVIGGGGVATLPADVARCPRRDRLLHRKNTKYYRVHKRHRHHVRYMYKRSRTRPIHVSDSSNSDSQSDYRTHDRRYRRRRITLRQSESSESHTSSDTDCATVDRSLLRNLNKAVRVETSTSELQQSSLSSRLKNMVSGGIDKCDHYKSSGSESDLNELRKLALDSKLNIIKKQSISIEDIPLPSDNTNGDIPNPCDTNSASPAEPSSTVVGVEDEAYQLRMDALRSAILKKHQARRGNRSKLKKKLADEGTDSMNVDVNENNDIRKSEDMNAVMEDLLDYVINQHGNDSEEHLTHDEVSMPSPQATGSSTLAENKENTSQPPPSAKEHNKTIEEDEDILRAMLLSSISKKVSQTSIPVLRNFPKTRTPTPVPAASQKSDKNTDSQVYKSTTPVPRLIINIGADSDTESDGSKTSAKMQFEESLSQFLKEERAKVDRQQAEADKLPSAVKRLPHSRQAEYIRLKKRLEDLSKNRLHLLSQKILSQHMNKLNSYDQIFGKLRTNSSEVATKVMPVGKPQGGNRAGQLNQILTTNNQNTVLKNVPLRIKQTTVKLNESQTSQKRFLEGKYMNLAPIVRRTKAAKLARDKADEKVTQLMRELSKAKARYHDLHVTYKACLQQYFMSKAVLDEAESKMVPAASSAAAKRPLTVAANSGGGVAAKKIRPAEEEGVAKGKASAATPLATDASLPVVSVAEQLEHDAPATTSAATTRTQPPAAAATQEAGREATAISERRRAIDGNHHIAVCPFDLQGTCKDAECEYRHLEKLAK